MHRRICAGNWKMHKTTGEAVAYVERFAPLVQNVPQNVELLICPPFTALQSTRDALRQAQGDKGRIKLGAQGMHWEQNGAYTTAISGPMLTDLSVEYVIIGHSEARQYFGETDEYVRLKTAAALKNGLTPIVAVGESLEQRRAGRAESRVIAQTLAALSGLGTEEVRRVVLAYEPIWAIGTGENCDPNDANEIMRAMRKCLEDLRDVPILYGGSVKPENIAQYVAQPEIDGALVGGASLDPESFAKLAIGAA